MKEFIEPVVEIKYFTDDVVRTSGLLGDDNKNDNEVDITGLSA